MVTDSELAEKLHEFLRDSDLKKTTNSIVIKKLESDFGVDLSDKKPFLRTQVDRFLQAQYEVFEEEEEHEIGGEDDDDDANDEVFDSDDDKDDDGYFDAIPTNINNNVNNWSNSLKGLDLLERSGRQNKEKNKRVCMSGRHCTLSPKLQKFLGVSHMTRAEVVKQLWIYVKEKKLQDPKDGKSIVCDETLRDLLGVNSINILQINKALTKHICPQVKPSLKYKQRKQDKGEEVKSLPNDKPRKQERMEDPCEDEMKEKRQKRALCGFLAPLPMSDTLIKFLDSGETALTRSDVIKRLWEYIKDNNLQDPSDKKTVICDEKLKELFNVDAFHGFTVSKLLSAHFVSRQSKLLTND